MSLQSFILLALLMKELKLGQAGYFYQRHEYAVIADQVSLSLILFYRFQNPVCTV